MKKINPLFIGYYYPPAGGKGLPASQRSIKFIRNMRDVESIYVLSIKPEKYPESIELNFNVSLPVNGEFIIREDSKDLFVKAMNLRKQIKQRLGNIKKDQKKNNQMNNYEAVSDTKTAQKLTIFQRMKDFIHYAYYLPDMESPWIKNAVKSGIQMVHKYKINVVFATGSPWSALIVGSRIASKTGVPLIADFRDPWVGNPFRNSKGNFLDLWENRLEKKVVESASVVSANTEPLRDEFLIRYPKEPKEKFITLPNGYDLIDFESIKQQSKTISSSKVILAHAGFLYGKRDPEPLLTAIENLIERFPDTADSIEFHQIGDISMDYSFNERYKKLIKSGHVKIFDQIPYEDCLKLLSQKDILVLIQPGTKTQVPSKLYDYLCLMRPILTITPYDGALGKIVTKHHFGEIVSPDEPEDLVKILYKLYKNKSNLCTKVEYKDCEIFNIKNLARTLENKMYELI